MPESGESIEQTILRLLMEAGPDRTISPTEVARAIAPDPNWHLRMPAVRRAAIGLALQGRVVIARKGKPVDARDFKGVYRLSLPRQD
jgi:uncharacterized protein DUF3253